MGNKEKLHWHPMWDHKSKLIEWFRFVYQRTILNKLIRYIPSMHLNGTEQLRRAIWCEIYVIRVGYIPYLKKFAKQLDSKEEGNRQ